MAARLADILRRCNSPALPVVLAPMEDVTGAAFRRICRTFGAALCITEFVGVEHVIANSELARRRTWFAADDRPTAIQIYGLIRHCCAKRRTTERVPRS